MREAAARIDALEREAELLARVTTCVTLPMTDVPNLHMMCDLRSRRMVA